MQDSRFRPKFFRMEPHRNFSPLPHDARSSGEIVTGPKAFEYEEKYLSIPQFPTVAGSMAAAIMIRFTHSKIVVP